MPEITFAGLVAHARRIAGMTAAEFDYSLQTGPDSQAYTAWDMALAAETDGDMAAYEVLRTRHLDEFRAMVEAAKSKSYTGWSAASRGPIRYAR